MSTVAARSEKNYHQDYIARIRHENALPPPPGAPKLLDIPVEGLDYYTSAAFASRLSRKQPLNIEADAELGMPINLVGMPGIFDGDESCKPSHWITCLTHCNTVADAPLPSHPSTSRPSSCPSQRQSSSTSSVGTWQAEISAWRSQLPTSYRVHFLRCKSRPCRSCFFQKPRQAYCQGSQACGYYEGRAGQRLTSGY